MTLKRMVNGVDVAISAAEEDQIRARWAQNKADQIASDAAQAIEDKIEVEEKVILREQAITNLTAKGEL